MRSIKEEKDKIREKIWRIMEERNIARFPRPVYGRIPNFVGAEIAANRLITLEFIRRAEVFKVNPDSPQRPVRELILRLGRKLIMPTPRLRGGFLVLDPSRIPRKHISRAATIRGAFIYGFPVNLRNIPKIDIIIIGSVAVARDGSRIGKGGGYSELEYGILREIGAINENTPVITTIHEVQLVDKLPQEEHDVPVDYIITNKRIIKVESKRKKPKGIIWSKITEDMMNKMPILKELKKIKNPL